MNVPDFLWKLFIILALIVIVFKLGQIHESFVDYRPCRYYNQQYDIGMHEGSKIIIEEDSK